MQSNRFDRNFGAIRERAFVDVAETSGGDGYVAVHAGVKGVCDVDATAGAEIGYDVPDALDGKKNRGDTDEDVLSVRNGRSHRCGCNLDVELSRFHRRRRDGVHCPKILHVPYLDSIIPRSRHKAAAIRTERDGPDRVCMARKWIASHGASVRIPYPYSLVL